MFRYLILVWQTENEHELRTVHTLQARLSDWRCAWQASGIRLYVMGERAGLFETLLLPCDAGALLGTLFARKDVATGRASAPIALRDLEDIAAEGARALLTRYWGRYLAVLRTPTGIRFLRGPSGALPTLYVSYEGVHLVFSDIAPLVETLGLPFTIDWEFIKAYTAYPFLMTRETGLTEVRELLPGESLHIERRRRALRLEWQPAEFANASHTVELRDAAELARHTMQHCVASWASRHPKILLRLSGGLDSSMIAYCLAHAGRSADLICLNHFGEGLQEDERHYARWVCEAIGCELIEHRHQSGTLNLAPLLEIPYSPRPAYYPLLLEQIPIAETIAQSRGATAMFTGDGGDALFFQEPGALAVADALLTRGRRHRAWRAALDAAQIEQDTLWSIGIQAVQALFDRMPHPIAKRYRKERSMVPSEVFDHFIRSSRYEDAWLADANRLLPGKRHHIRSTEPSGIPFYPPFATEEIPDLIRPIHSQPVLELFYALPLATLIEGGWDRAVIRCAFEGLIPPQVIGRRGKGANTRALRQTLDANRTLIRSWMLDGELVRRGWLDRGALDAILSPNPKMAAFAYVLLDYLPLEMWLRKWQRGRLNPQF